MAGILPKVKVSDVPENRAQRLKTLGIVGEVNTREIANGYVQLTVPLYFLDGGAEVEQLEKVAPVLLDALDNDMAEQFAAANNVRTFTARWNVRPEWFESSYAEVVRNGGVSETEKIQYNINMSGLTRGLAKAAGLDEIDFDALRGRIVGFTTRNRKDDPSRLEIAAFYAPRRGKAGE